MKKVLITGASGFIGRQCLTPLLERGFEVHAVARKPITGCEKDIIWHCQNLLDDEKTQRLLKTIQPSHCLHFAWYTEPGKYWSSAENLRWAASSISLIHSFHQQGGQRFVGAGSCAEYDWHSGHCIEEVTALEPATLYGTCKNSVQKILSSFSASTAMSSAWGRVFFLFGPHEHPARLVPMVINALLRDEPALCSHGNQIRDFMHVSDAANAFVALLESDAVGPINIASGKSVSIRDVIYTIAENLNGFDKIKLNALTVNNNEPTILTSDVRRLQEAINFQTEFDLGSGLEQTINWWKKSFLEMNK